MEGDISSKDTNSASSKNLSSGFIFLSDSLIPTSNRYVDYTADFPPGFGPGVVGIGRVESNEGSDGGDGFHWRRPVGAVKSKPGVGGECHMMNIKKHTKTIVGNSLSMNDHDVGEVGKKLGEILRMFRRKCDEIANSEKNVKRGDCRARTELIKEGKITKGFNLLLGEVPGVRVGDEFKYRVELEIVGLHKMLEKGIDYMVYKGETVATCIVATERYLDKMRDPEVLTYIGEGGKSQNPVTGLFSDQKLKGGNLALWNSKKMKTPVRVVKGFKDKTHNRVRNRMVPSMRYIYDGLYEVVSCERKKGLQGNMIYEFELLRCPGQPNVSLGENCNRTRL